MAIRKELTFETGNTINWPEGRFTANSGVFASTDTANGVPAGAPTPHVARLTAGSPDPLRGPGSARSQLGMKNSDPPYGWNPAKPWVWGGIDGFNGAERWLRGSFYVQTGKFTPLYDPQKGDSQLTYGWHSVDGVNLYFRVTPDKAHWEVLVRGGNLLPTPKDPATGKYIPPLIATGYDAGINLLGIGPWFVSIQHSKVYPLAPIVFDKWIEVVIHNLYKPDLTGFTEIHFVVDGVVTNVLPRTPAALIYNNINFSAPYPNGPGLGTERDGIKSCYHEQENYQPGIPALDPPSEMWFGGSAIYDSELDVWTSTAHTALRPWPWPGIGTLPPSVDVMSPTINFTTPAANGAVLTGIVQLEASGTDNIGIDHVDFKIDGVTFATDTYPPFVKNLDTTALNPNGTRKYPDGAHTLTAAAYDAAGNSNTSTRTVTIDNTIAPPPPPPDPPSDTPPPPADTTPPTCTLTAPANASTATGVITVSATAADNVAVSKVDFLLDGVVFATDLTAPFSTTWDSATAPDGSHTIGARATDASGNMSTVSQVTVTASNATAPPPDPTPEPPPVTPPDPTPGGRLPYCGTIGGVSSAPAPDVPPPPPPTSISKVQDIGVASSGSLVASRTISVAAGVTAGNRVTVAGVVGADVTVTVTDSGNNVYTTRPYALHSSGNTKLFLADAQIVTALGLGDTIKVTASASTTFAVAAQEWAGINRTAPFVSFAFVQPADIPASTTVTLTAPAAAVPDKGLVLVLFAGTNQNAIVTPSTGFTDLAGTSNSGTGARFIDSQWQVVTPAATVTPGAATFSTKTAATQAVAATAVYAIAT